MFEVVVDGLEDVEQGLVDDDDAILGVGRNVAQVIWAQTRVERVDHGSHQRNREVQLEVLGLVPQQGRHAIAILDPQPGEGGREPPGALRAIAQRGATDRSVGTTRDDRCARIQSLRPLDEHCQRELKVVHHQTVQHGFAPFLKYVVR